MEAEKLEDLPDDESHPTGILNLDLESLANCFLNLSKEDLVSAALTCKQFKASVNSHSVWQHQYQKRWPRQWQDFQGSREQHDMREVYMRRHRAGQQFAFRDPAIFRLATTSACTVKRILIDHDKVVVSQGSKLAIWTIKGPLQHEVLDSHSATVTCMQSVPGGTFAKGAGNLIITGSMDHTLRVWNKGKRVRTFKGHSGPVTALADRFVGGENCPPVTASGSFDATIRLWSLAAGRGRSPLAATFAGHQEAVADLAVAAHNPSLLVSLGLDAKVKAWDAGSSAQAATASVGTAKVPGPTRAQQPMRCVGSTCYVAGKHDVVVVDLRTMTVTSTVATIESGEYLRCLALSGDTLCTGADDQTAQVWDVRMAGRPDDIEPVAILGGHKMAVTHIHIDPYKVVTAGDRDRVRVWDPNTGDELRVVSVYEDEDPNTGTYDRVTALAVLGSKMVVGSMRDERPFLTCWDFESATEPMHLVMEEECNHSSSKFWESSPKSSVPVVERWTSDDLKAYVT